MKQFSLFICLSYVCFREPKPCISRDQVVCSWDEAAGHHWNNAVLFSVPRTGDMSLPHPTPSGTNLTTWPVALSTLKSSFSPLQLISIGVYIYERSYSDILLISCTSSNLCSSASASIDSFCLNLFYDDCTVVILYFLYLIVDILVRKFSW